MATILSFNTKQAMNTMETDHQFTTPVDQSIMQPPTPNRITGITFNNRMSPTDLAGINVRGSMTVDKALQISGLDWRVDQHIMTDAMTGSIVPGFKLNVRSTDNKVLGVVSDRYRICQNYEAFDFVNDIVANGEIQLETAGMAKNGQKVWMEAKMPDMDILGEPSSPYILFVNTHDGTGAVRVCFTTVRVWCKNMLSLATRSAERSFSIQHKGNLEEKMNDVRETLTGAAKYFDNLSTEIEELAKIKMDNNQVEKVVKALFPIKDDEESLRKIANAEESRAELLYRYKNADDLNNIRGTAYGFIAAVSDFASHSVPHRQTASYYENNLMRLVSGNSIVDDAYKIVRAA